MKQLYTKWGRNLDETQVLPEYPRPQMVRDSYYNLNGQWEYAIAPEDPACYDGTIVVPFSPESVLSGVERQLMPYEVLWYHRTFLFSRCDKERLLLHFGAVDQSCRVYVNDRLAGSHMGGYLPFTLDITDLTVDGENHLKVRVTDASDTSFHARGKQKLERGGMFYTATSGIWQSVWMERVPEHYIHSVRQTPDLDQKAIRLFVTADEKRPVSVEVYAPQIYAEPMRMPADLQGSLQDVVARGSGQSFEEIVISIPEPLCWSQDTPYLYYCRITMGDDEVVTYFALRKFSREPAISKEDGKSYMRIFLNHEEQFQRGVLDQGYWPDGIYTAPSDEALIFDIEEMKKTGFNMVRKHIKIEAERWYYHCDRLGIAVWQDMVNGGGYYKHWFLTYLATPISLLHIPVNDRLHALMARSDRRGRDEFEREMQETITLLYNHPSIAVWVIFNEGWGQFATNRMAKLAAKADSTRLIDEASGWFDQRGGDFQSVHNYMFPLIVTPESGRISVLSEFGGDVFFDPEHSACDKQYGYGNMKDLDALNKTYERLNGDVDRLRKKGLSASVYTQWTDVEEEVNGIYTYDREVRKIKGKEV